MCTCVGIFFVLPCIDTYTKVDLRTVTFDVPPQEVDTVDLIISYSPHIGKNKEEEKQ